MKSINELRNFGEHYARAWCSQNPESVASFFAENGWLSVNDSSPAIGRAAIADIARQFMRDFPDMVVTMDDLTPEPDGAKFHWTLSGSNTGPGGPGKRVLISGYELWQFDNDGLIERSKGHFDSAEYDRQITEGVGD